MPSLVFFLIIGDNNKNFTWKTFCGRTGYKVLERHLALSLKKNRLFISLLIRCEHVARPNWKFETAHCIINDPCLFCVVVCSRLLLLWTTHSFSNKKVSGKWINRMREKANVFELPRPTPTNPGLWVLASLCFPSSVGLKPVLKVSIFTLFFFWTGTDG